MQPSIIYETLVNDSVLAGLLGTTSPIEPGTRVFELQSLNERPDVADGYFIVIDMQGSDQLNPYRLGPRMMQIWVHSPIEWGADYDHIVRIQNQIDRLIMPLEQAIGNDGVRLTLIKKHGRSKNTEDPGWRTATRNALYGVLHDEANI